MRVISEALQGQCFPISLNCGWKVTATRIYSIHLNTGNRLFAQITPSVTLSWRSLCWIQWHMKCMMESMTFFRLASFGIWRTHERKQANKINIAVAYEMLCERSENKFLSISARRWRKRMASFKVLVGNEWWWHRKMDISLADTIHSDNNHHHPSKPWGNRNRQWQKQQYCMSKWT